MCLHKITDSEAIFACTCGEDFAVEISKLKAGRGSIHVPPCSNCRAIINLLCPSLPKEWPEAYCDPVVPEEDLQSVPVAVDPKITKQCNVLRKLAEADAEKLGLSIEPAKATILRKKDLVSKPAGDTMQSQHRARIILNHTLLARLIKAKQFSVMLGSPKKASDIPSGYTSMAKKWRKGATMTAPINSTLAKAKRKAAR